MKKILFLTLLMLILAGVCLTSCFNFGTPGNTNNPDDDSTTGKSYTVTFDSDGGSSVAKQTVASGKYAKEPAAPTKSGYIFSGWYYGKTRWDFSIPITENMTLKAKWSVDPASCSHSDSTNDGICDNCGTALVLIKFYSDGGTAVASQTVKSGSCATEPTAPTKENYIFAGWYKGSSKWNFSTPVTADITLTAKWEPDLSNCAHRNVNEDDYCDICNERLRFNIVYKDGSQALSFSAKYTSYSILDTSFTLPTPTKSHHEFLGWFEDELLTKHVTSIDVTKGGDITLYASFTPITYTVEYNLDGGTNSQSNPTSLTVRDLPLVLLAPEKEGYTFGGWYKNPALTQPIEEINNDNVDNLTLYAKWIKIEIKFTVTYLDHLGNVLAVDTLYKSENDQPLRSYTDFPALNVAGYVFLGWVNPENESEKYVRIPAGNETDMVVKAYMKNEVVHHITYYIDGSSYATEVFLEVEGFNSFYTPTKGGYTFDGWYSDSACTTKVTAIAPGTTNDVALYGKFTPNVYNISFTVDGAAFNAGITQYAVSDEGTLLPEIPAKEGYVILGWYTSDDQLMVENKIAGGYFGDLELHAVYKKISYKITYYLNGGANDERNVTEYCYEELPTLYSAVYKQDYVFAGWYTDASYSGEPIISIEEVANQDVSLFALWIPYVEEDTSIETPIVPF